MAHKRAELERRRGGKEGPTKRAIQVGSDDASEITPVILAGFVLRARGLFDEMSTSHRLEGGTNVVSLGNFGPHRQVKLQGEERSSRRTTSGSFKLASRGSAIFCDASTEVITGPDGCQSAAWISEPGGGPRASLRSLTETSYLCRQCPV